VRAWGGRGHGGDGDGRCGGWWVMDDRRPAPGGLCARGGARRSSNSGAGTLEEPPHPARAPTST
jgi:hypothetical protein